MTPAQQQAARLVGQGLTRREIAKALGTSEQTITRWRKLPGFEELARRTRAETGDPTAISTLRDALLATRRDGQPDWQTRVQAARALLLPAAQADPGAGESDTAPRIEVFTRA